MRDRVVYLAIFTADSTEWLYRSILVLVTVYEAYAVMAVNSPVAGWLLAAAVGGMHFALRTRLHPDDDPDLRFLVETVMLGLGLVFSGYAGGWISAVPLLVLGSLYLYGFLRYFQAVES
jgi:hypothetical protein